MIAKMAIRQSKSQWQRPDWKALLLSIFLMTSLLTLLNLTAERLQKSLVVSGAAMLGADLVLSSSRPLEEQIEASLITSGLSTSRVTQFATMVNAGESMLLSSVRAVSSPYPLRGEITTQTSSPTPLPSPGRVWVEPAVLERLNIAVGDTLSIGYQDFLIDNVFLSSPDRGSGFRSFNPQIIMRETDLASTQVISPGSRAQYRLLISGTPQAIATAEQTLKPTLADWQRLYSAHGDQPTTQNSLRNASSYLKLSALMAVLIGSFSIYLSLRRFAQAQQARTALLMSLGLSRYQLFQLFSLILGAGWLMAAIPGSLLGWIAHEFLMSSLSDLLPQPLPSISVLTAISSLLLCGLLIAAIGIATLLPLGGTTVLSLIKSSEDHASTANPMLKWVLAALIVIVTSFFVPSPQLALVLTLGLLLFGGLAGLAVQQLIKLFSQQLVRYATPIPLLALRIKQQRHWHRVQGGVLSLLLALMTVILFARQDLLSDWQGQLPEDTPNQFVINIQPWESANVSQWLRDADVKAQLYPMIRGRIEAYNGTPIDKAFNTEQRQHNTLNRELNLTWSDQFPAHNQLIEGEWRLDANAISVEASMAQELGLQLGDQLDFRVGSELFKGTITSLRKVEWASFRPNFYVIFSPGVIDQLPATYITSYRTGEGQSHLSGELLKAFPTLTLIDIEQLLKQVQNLINTLSDSASLIMLLTLLSGLVLLITTLQQDLAKRQYEVALLRTLGASAQQTRQLDTFEYLLMGLSCGIIATLITEATLLLIYQQWLKLPPQPHVIIWFMLPMIATCLFGAMGFLSRKALSLPDSYHLLRSKG
ncbi:ABC transporter permease [Neptunomonas concharum]|uniref:FtsX-like permease family protein n=1 Tax=Neptunomonas concharum TaxID=1031538 RepID=A0A5P1RG33_9GAMM|nr:FtsX-like permease family protein [Neptunomonas concharum]QEQ98122.1 FtsX-like permease family protein [Neptunomonas concharum]